MVRPDGQVRWVRTRGFPVLDAAGRLYRNAGVASDITESKLVSLELKESERRFSEMLENVELVSLMLDLEARLTYCNQYLLRLTGWRKEEILGRSVFDFLIPLEDPRDEGVLRDASGWHARVWDTTRTRSATRTGERRLIRWSNTFLRSPAGDVSGVASIGEDITEQKRTESKIARLNRVTTVLGSINSLLVRASDRDELFREACRIAVEAGGFRTTCAGWPRALPGGARRGERVGAAAAQPGLRRRDPGRVIWAGEPQATAGLELEIRESLVVRTSSHSVATLSRSAPWG